MNKVESGLDKQMIKEILTSPGSIRMDGDIHYYDTEGVAEQIQERVAQAVQEALAERDKELKDHLYMAWTIIANANEGNWDNATPEWKQAAEKWRDGWHKLSGKPTYEYDVMDLLKNSTKEKK